jgi:DNA modification methylase
MTGRVEVIGNCRLYLGNCLEVMPLLGKVDVVVTDPPYGVNLQNLRRKTKVYRDDDQHIRTLIRQTIPMALSIATRAVIFCGQAMLWEYPEPASLGCVFNLAGTGRTAWGFQCTQPVLFYGKDPFMQDGKGGRPNSFLDRHAHNGDKHGHPCPKPLSWMKWAVGRASRIGETVLDPFMGSGTTGVACANMGRSFVGIELDETYFDIACQRIRRACEHADLFIERPKPPIQQLLL